jgi:2-phosphosulfolactate phosphatase
LAGGTAVVIDVLRATTTTIHALAAGAAKVIPYLEVEDARRAAAAMPADSCILGGERGGVRIAGFDLGNSPNEYAPHVVSGKTVLITTTNGTKALLHCRLAERIMLGAFVNLSAVCRAVRGRPRVDLVCAGTRDEIAREDALLAGAMVERLTANDPLPNGSKPNGSTPSDLALNDQALIARDLWRCVARDCEGSSERLARRLGECRGGCDLAALGMSSDIVVAADIDRFDIVPRWDPIAGHVGRT